MIYLLIIVAVAALIFSVLSGPRQTREISITEVAADIKKGVVKSIVLQGDLVTVEYRDPNMGMRSSRKETDRTLLETLGDLGVTSAQLADVSFKVEPPGVWADWASLLITIVPLLVFGALLFFMVRQAQGTNNQALSFGKSRARMFTGDKPTVTFDDVAGVDEA
ncbi:MAG: cell division protein FtsH, partial [Ardenticatenia bacterium]